MNLPFNAVMIGGCLNEQPLCVMIVLKSRAAFKCLGVCWSMAVLKKLPTNRH